LIGGDRYDLFVINEIKDSLFQATSVSSQVSGRPRAGPWWRDVERRQVGAQGLRPRGRAGARGERLQEAEEVLWRRSSRTSRSAAHSTLTEQKIFHKYVKGFRMSEPEESGPEDHTCPRHDASARE